MLFVVAAQQALCAKREQEEAERGEEEHAGAELATEPERRQAAMHDQRAHEKDHRRQQHEEGEEVAESGELIEPGGSFKPSTTTTPLGLPIAISSVAPRSSAVRGHRARPTHRVHVRAITFREGAMLVACTGVSAQATLLRCVTGKQQLGEAKAFGAQARHQLHIQQSHGWCPTRV